MLPEDLDGDGAIEAGVPRSVDLTHPTGAQQGDDLVGPESRASRQSHIEARKVDRFAPGQSGRSNTLSGNMPVPPRRMRHYKVAVSNMSPRPGSSTGHRRALPSTTSFHEGNEFPASHDEGRAPSTSQRLEAARVQLPPPPPHLRTPAASSPASLHRPDHSPHVVLQHREHSFCTDPTGRGSSDLVMAQVAADIPANPG